MDTYVPNADRMADKLRWDISRQADRLCQVAEQKARIETLGEVLAILLDPELKDRAAQLVGDLIADEETRIKK